MGRIIKTIEIEGRPAIALFDTGATYSYVRSALVAETPRQKMPRPVHVALGGQRIVIKEVRLITGKVEGLPFLTDAVPVKKGWRIDSHEVDVILGARTMEQWEIRLDPKSGELDLEGLRRREFTEYMTGDA